MKNILVPTDFSDVANHALHLAGEIAQRTGATLELLHVVETVNTLTPPDGEDPTAGKWFGQLEGYARTQLQTLSERFPGVEVRTRVGRGSPFRNIDQRALESGADLIVMGSEGSSGLDELLIGSNAERVVRFAPCPVLVVKSLLRLEDIKRVAFFTSLKEDLIEEMPRFLKFWKLLDAELHVVRVNTPQDWVSSRFAERQMRTFDEKHGVNARFTLYSAATAEDGIHHFSTDVGIHLIAMPTHARKGLARLIAGGSTTENVLNHTRIAFWTCRHEDGD
ncbi:MAG: universal stress protein [Catalinimonas sp.]